jgi:hypothetical protein
LRGILGVPVHKIMGIPINTTNTSEIEWRGAYLTRNQNDKTGVIASTEFEGLAIARRLTPPSFRTMHLLQAPAVWEGECSTFDGHDSQEGHSGPLV